MIKDHFELRFGITTDIILLNSAWIWWFYLFKLYCVLKGGQVQLSSVALLFNPILRLTSIR